MAAGVPLARDLQAVHSMHSCTACTGRSKRCGDNAPAAHSLFLLLSSKVGGVAAHEEGQRVGAGLQRVRGTAVLLHAAAAAAAEEGVETQQAAQAAA